MIIWNLEQIWFAKSNMELNIFHKKLCLRIISLVAKRLNDSTLEI